MGITAHFRNKLGAQLCQIQKSWGAVRRADGVIFLRVWDESVLLESQGKRTFARLAFHDWYEDDPENWGYQERCSHIENLRERIRANHAEIGYAVMCTPKHLPDGRRSIKSFVSETVRPIIGIQDRENDVWAELGPAVPVDNVRMATVAQH